MPSIRERAEALRKGINGTAFADPQARDALSMLVELVVELAGELEEASAKAAYAAAEVRLDGQNP
jgi:hypothetical protein